jgi:hypothetical protein
MADAVKTLRVELTGGSLGLQKSLADAASAAGRMGVELRAVQGGLDKITAARPTGEMKALDLAVRGLGGTAQLTREQLGRVTVQVNQLAAAGAKVPESLSGLTGMGSKLGAAFQALTTGGGISGALAAIGPAGVAAAAGLAAITGGATAAYRAVSDLASQAEQWGNVSAATGISVESVQKLQDYLVDAGFDATDLTRIMKAMQSEIASGGKSLEKYGISLEPLKDKTAEEQLRLLAQAISSIEDPMVRGAAATEAFGRGGSRALAAIAGLASGDYLQMAAMTAAQVAELQRIDKELDAAGRAWENWKKRAVYSMLQVAQSLMTVRTVPGVPSPSEAAAIIRDARAQGFAHGPAGGGGAGAAAEQERQRRVADMEAAKERKEAEKAAKEAAKSEKELTEKRKAAVEALYAAEAAELRRNIALAQASMALRQDLVQSALAGMGYTAGPRGTRAALGAVMPGLPESSAPVPGSLGSPQDAAAAAMNQAEKNAQAALAAGLGEDQVRAKLEAMGLTAQEAASMIERLSGSFQQTKGSGDTWINALGAMGQALQGLGGVAGQIGGALTGVAGTLKQLGTGAGGKFSLGQLGSSMKTMEGKMAVGGAVAQGLGAIGNALQKGGKADNKMVAGQALAGAAKGAQMGAMLGPYGMLAGAVIGGAIGFLKGNKIKKEAKAAGGILGREIGVEELKQLKEQAKAAGKSLKEHLKDVAKEEKRQKEIAARQKLEAGLTTARGGAENLIAKLEGNYSSAAKAAFSKLIGKVSDALMKAGLGVLDARLSKSEEFMGAQSAAADVTQILTGMRQAGIIDDDTIRASEEATIALRDQAIAAARAAGLSEAEAQRAGSAAVAGLLREQLNVNKATGRQNSSQLDALLAEAKANGIEILADPAVEAVEVAKESRDYLKTIAEGPPPEPSKEGKKSYEGDTSQNTGGSRTEEQDRGGRETAAKGFGPVITPNLGGGLGPLIQTHPGELVWIVPKSDLGSAMVSAAGGLGGYGWGRYGSNTFPSPLSDAIAGWGTPGGSQVNVNLAISENPFQTTEGAARLRRYTLDAVERETSKHLAALIAAGRA